MNLSLMHIFLSVRQDGINFNVVRVSYLSRDVGLQDILEGAHLYEFHC